MQAVSCMNLRKPEIVYGGSQLPEFPSTASTYVNSVKFSGCSLVEGLLPSEGMSTGVAHSATLYFTDIAKTTPISDLSEERRLIQQWQRRKDVRARDTLVSAHLRFVVTLARKRSRDPDRLSDLIAAGNLGLLKAVDKYDLGRRPAPRFLTYAGWWIQKEIADEDYATSSLVHVPTHRQKAQRKRARVFQRALQEGGADNPLTTTLDPGTPEGATVAFDELREAADGEPESTPVVYDIQRSNHLLRRAISQLPSREQSVLNLYYGTKDDPRNLVQIAVILGMCPERVRQIKINGMRLLREILGTHTIAAAHDVY